MIISCFNFLNQLGLIFLLSWKYPNPCFEQKAITYKNQTTFTDHRVPSHLLALVQPVVAQVAPVLTWPLTLTCQQVDNNQSFLCQFQTSVRRLFSCHKDAKNERQSMLLFSKCILSNFALSTVQLFNYNWVHKNDFLINKILTMNGFAINFLSTFSL